MVEGVQSKKYISKIARIKEIKEFLLEGVKLILAH